MPFYSNQLASDCHASVHCYMSMQKLSNTFVFVQITQRSVFPPLSGYTSYTAIYWALPISISRLVYLGQSTVQDKK